MSSTSALWPVLIAVGILSILTYLSGIAAAILWRHKSSRASNYVLAGLGVLMLGWVVRLIVPAVVARTAGAASTALVAIWMQLSSAIAFAVGLAFLVAAAFVDRDPNRPSREADEYLPGDPKAAETEPNPYAASDPQ